MNSLHGLVEVGAIPLGFCAVARILRDLLRYRLEREILRRTRDDQLLPVVRALTSARRQRNS